MISWTPLALPSPGEWAGQTNHFGFRYNRYSNGGGYGWIPLWVIAVLLVIVALVAMRLSRSGGAHPFPIVCITVCSLLPLVLVLLCIRSFLQSDTISTTSASRPMSVRLEKGRIILFRLYWIGAPPKAIVMWDRYHGRDFNDPTPILFPPQPQLTAPGWRNGFGFATANITVGATSPPRGVSVDAIAIPYGPLSLLSTVPLILRVRAHRRRVRRDNEQLCRKCGYDLRATPDRCPECGAFPAGLESGAQASSVP